MVVVPIVSTAIATFEAGHDYEHGLATMCAAIATGGAFLTVPDTEHVALLAGAGTVVGVLVLLEPRLALGGELVGVHRCVRVGGLDRRRCQGDQRCWSPWRPWPACHPIPPFG